MSYSNNIVNWSEIIKFTAEGIVVADYTQVRTALVNRFKDIYGEDIDVSTNSADGIYLETLSLMVNNILQSFKSFYSCLDIRTASGTYLDMLCLLSNVTRKDASSSTCYLTITLDEDEVQTSVNELNFVDNGGLIWRWSDSTPITLNPGISQTLLVKCQTLGEIRATKGTLANDYTDGWISKTVNSSPVIKVQQMYDANPGQLAETDSELRARQHLSGNASGNTVLESLAGAILQNSAIEDVLIYNNDTIGNLTSLDGTTIPAHSVYVVLRKEPNIEVADKQIGTILHNKLTPGIHTAESLITEDKHSFVYITELNGQQIGSAQTYYWKQATPVHPTLVITIKPGLYFSTSDNNTCEKIANNIINELNNVHLGSTVTNFTLQQIVNYSDPLFRGNKTYEFVSATLNGSTSNYTLQDTFFNYTTISITQSTSNYIITIS